MATPEHPFLIGDDSGARLFCRDLIPRVVHHAREQQAVDQPVDDAVARGAFGLGDRLGQRRACGAEVAEVGFSLAHDHARSEPAQRVISGVLADRLRERGARDRERRVVAVVLELDERELFARTYRPAMTGTERLEPALEYLLEVRPCAIPLRLIE